MTFRGDPGHCVPVTRWPVWRLLVWIEAWLLAVMAVHRARSIHEAFVVPLLLGIVPAIALVALWGLARAAVGQGTAPAQRANWLEASLAVTSVAAAAVWIADWALQALDDLRRFDAIAGQATVIVDVSLTGLSAAACLAALTLDWILATAHAQFQRMMTRLRRMHVATTAIYIIVLFGSAWLLTQWPDMPGADAHASFEQARTVLYAYEFAKATVFPVQAFFAAMAVAVVTLDSRTT